MNQRGGSRRRWPLFASINRLLASVPYLGAGTIHRAWRPKQDGRTEGHAICWTAYRVGSILLFR